MLAMESLLAGSQLDPGSNPPRLIHDRRGPQITHPAPGAVGTEGNQRVDRDHRPGGFHAGQVQMQRVDNLTVDEIALTIARRDERDSTRADSPLRKADDAVELDTTSLTIEQQVDRVIDLAVARGAAPPDGRTTRHR